ncbi:MAG: hypothetical protein SGARI_007904 [Bacillariaceae sp.]
MQCIIKLRDDLIQEMKARRRSIFNSSDDDRKPSPSPSLLIPSLHQSPNAAATHNEQDNTVEIPEIPPLSFMTTAGGGDDPRQRDENSSMMGGMGFVGRGFTMLHAMVTSYAPVMDRWLKNVMTIVPEDSECLLNFLWEPTGDNFYNVSSLLESKDSTGSSGSMLSGGNHRISMGSIKELDIEDDA